MLMKTDMATDRSVRQVRRYRNTQRKNALQRALIGALLLLDLPIKTKSLSDAALKVGSTPKYVAAMKLLVESLDGRLLDAVLDGHVPLLKAAASTRNRAKLFTAYEASSPDDRAALGEFAGPDAIWDDVLIPNIS